MVALGAVLALGAEQEGASRGLELGRAQAAVIEEMAIAPALGGRPLSEGLSAEEQARLQSATDLAIFRGSVDRLRLRDFDGVVVFSDDGTVDGALPMTDPAFVAAAAGRTDVALPEHPDDAGSIRVLQPVIANASGRAVGVLEIYLPYDAIAAEVEESQRQTYWRLGAGLAVLYVVLACISWSTTRRLRRQAAQSAHDALHDPLTGLPNRELFRLRLEETIRQGVPASVVLVDLDRFKEVNDALGHHAGDELIRVVARCLSAAIRTDDDVARLGGDEFGLLLAGIDSHRDAEDLLRRVCDELLTQTVLDGVPLAVEASFGVAMYPRHGRDVETLLRSADTAMYQGKRGTQGIVVYDPSNASAPSHHLAVQHDMRRALTADQLVLHYQPKIDLGSGEIVGVEALVRWQHPERGLLPPSEFLPAVEQSGLIDPLTRWVLTRSIHDCVRWSARGLGWNVAVNVSARNLDGPGFADLVARMLSEAGLGPDRLQLEVTETALGVDADAAERTLDALARCGVAVALDDFGVGYASLSHLRSLALAEVKIDREFIRDLERSDSDREVVCSLVQLAHGLGLTVTAEGVESGQVASWLLSAGCDSAQGYFFARPAPWQELLGVVVPDVPRQRPTAVPRGATGSSPGTAPDRTAPGPSAPGRTRGVKS